MFVCFFIQLHLVHWNIDKFKSAGEAIEKDQGIAVLTAFIKVSSGFCQE